MGKLNLSDKAVVISIGQGISSAITFISGMFLVRLVSKEDYGTYMQVLLVYSILAPILSMGISTSIYYFIPRLSDEEQKTFAWQTIAVSFLLGFISSLILYMASGIFSNRFNNSELKPLLHIYFLFPLFKFPISCLLPFLIVANRCSRAAVMEVISVILLEILSVVVPLALGYDLLLVFRAKVFFAGVIFLVVLWHIIKIYGGLPRLNAKLLQSQLKYSVPLGLSSIAGYITRQVDKLLISAFFSVTSYAIYARGAFEIPFIDVLAGAVMTVIMPELSRLHNEDKYDEFLRLWHESIRKVALILLPLSVFLFIVARDLITLLYSESYVNSANIFRIYLLLLPLRITIYGNVLLSVGLSKTILLGSIPALLSTIVFNLLGIKFLGFYGPAVAFVLSTDILILFYLSRIKHALKISFSKVFPWLSVGKIMAISCVAGVCIYPIVYLTLPNLLRFALSGMIFVLFYVLSSLKWGIICKDDVNLVKKWIGLKICK